MSRLLTLQEIMESDSIDLLRIYYGDLTLQSKKIDDMLNEQAGAVARGIPYLARAAARAASRSPKSFGKVVSPFSKKEVPKIMRQLSPLSKKVAKSGSKSMTKVSPLSKPGELAKNFPKLSKDQAKKAAKKIAKEGTTAEKTDYMTNVIKMRMAGSILDGDLQGYLSLLGEQFVYRALSGVAGKLGIGVPFLKLILAVGGGLIAGTAAGLAINRAWFGDDYEEQAEELIAAAMKNPKLAVDELELYCFARGGKCKREGGDTECAGYEDASKIRKANKNVDKRVSLAKSAGKKPKHPGHSAVGGYAYETVGEIDTNFAKWFVPGGGTGRELFGVPGFRHYKQTPGQMHVKDVALMLAFANAVILNDIRNNKAVLNTQNRTIEFKGSAEYLKYKKCVEGVASSPLARKTISRFSFLKSNYDLVQAASGLPLYSKLEKIRKADIKKKDDKPFTPVGPTDKSNKCNNFPMNVGCKGKQVATTLGILLRGTEFGKEQFAANRQSFTELFNKQEYTPELKDFFEQAVSSITPEEMQTYTDNIKIMGIEEDPVTDTPQKIASDFAKANGQITSGNQFDMLLGKLAAANNIKLNEKLRDLFTLRSLIYEVLEEQELLTEGGAGGHMRHPFDLDDVETGKDLIEKFEQIGSEIQGGNTPDTKIDGVNASIKVIDGPEGKEFAIDRGGVSKDDIQGISKSRLVTRFQDFIGIKPEVDGKSEVREQRIIAKIQPDGTRVPYNWLEKSNPDSPKIAVGDKVIYKKTKLSPEKEVEITSIRPHGMRTGGNTLLSIFNDALPEIEGELRELGLLDDPSKFFNMEFVKTGVNNVLNYDHNFLKIHGVNQFYEKTNRGKAARSGLERPEGIHDPSVPVDYDKEVMDRMVEKINKFSDKYDFKVYSYIPSKATGEFDFNPVLSVPVPVTYSKDNIEEANLGQRLDKAVNRIGEMVELKSGRTIPVQGKEIYQAVLGTSAEDTNADPARQTPLDELLANEEDYQKAIDGAVFWHATRLMGNVIMNNMVVDHPAVKGPATDHEGLVIKLAGDDFGTKITGEFILGGEATSFRKPANADSKVEKEVEYKNIAIFPGSFKPPHKGHLSVIERVAKNPEVDEIKVIISAPGKNVRSAKITPEKAKETFEKFISSSNIDKPVSIEVSSKPSPITAAYDYIGEKAGPNENVLLLTSEADSKRYPQESLDKYASMNKNAETLTVKGLVLPVCKDEGCQTTGKISATTIRNIVDAYPDITLEDLTKAVDHMPDSMPTADKLAAFEMLVDDSLSNKFEDEELNTLNESVRFIMETIDKALDVVLLTEKVRKTRGKKEYCVVSKKKKTKEGKLRTYGCYKSKEAADKRLSQVKGFEARAMAEGEELEEYQIIEVSTGTGLGGYSAPLGMTRGSIIRKED